MKNNMRKLLTILFLLSSALTFSQNYKVIDQVIWVVGDEPILYSDIENEIQRRKYEKTPIEGDPYCTIPEQIALQKLFIAGAKLDSLTVSDAAVDQQVDARIRFFISQIGSKEKLEEYFNRPLNKLKEEMANNVRDQLLVQQMQQHIVSDVRISPQDVKRFYDKMPKDSIPNIPEMVEVQIIGLFPEITAAEEERIKSQLRDFREKIESGSYQFSTLAILYSEDRGSALQGGELGFMTKGKLVPEFANMAFSLYDKNKVSRIVKTEFGYHIIQLIERKNDQVNCRHILLVPKVGLKEKEDASNKLDSIATAIRMGETTFGEAALTFSEDENSKQNEGIMINPQNGTTKFQLQNLPSDIAKVVYTMKEGEISAPFMYKNESGKEMVCIVRLKSRIKAHKANPQDDYQALKDMVTASKNQELIEKWIKEKQQETFIQIAPEYKNCQFRYPGWIK
ncbi:MAG: peptidylprolyl isomerase [Paludibacteraceae bacterium]|nr:peptidylprolyl isomerase [Paludibacteraceae bacterium]